MTDTAFPQRRYTAYAIGAMLCGFSALGIAGLASAEDFTSANFISRDPIFGDFGGRGDSAGFQLINAGGQTDTGESASTNFLMRIGFLYFDSFAPKSQNWRWYDDDTNETPATALAAENVAPTNIADQNIVKLRLTIKETADTGMGGAKLRLQFSTVSDFSSGVSELVASGSCAGNSVWCYADGAGADNGIITAKVLSDADACSGGAGDGCGTHNESGTSQSSFTHKKSAATEYEFTVKQSGAAANTIYFFRAFDVVGGKAVPLNTSESYPSLATEGATLTFSVSGLSSGTPTGGVTTDVGTTPTGVSFGALSVSAETEGAQRLSVTTNATAGYQIFVLQTQGLLGSGAAEIVSVDAANATPAAWAIPSSARGAYGYHTTDPTLAGGSSRFAADNTYAKFETAAKEIAYSAGPVTDETTDLVYKTQITNQQDAGIYGSSIVYIIVPVF